MICFKVLQHSLTFLLLHVPTVTTLPTMLHLCLISRIWTWLNLKLNLSRANPFSHLNNLWQSYPKPARICSPDHFMCVEIGVLLLLAVYVHRHHHYIWHILIYIAYTALFLCTTQGLMVNETSPILEHYACDFQIDLSGKQHEWEAVVLVPFMKEDALKSAMEPIMDLLSDRDKAHNRHGPCLQYQLSQKQAEFTYLSPWIEKFPDVMHCRVE